MQRFPSLRGWVCITALTWPLVLMLQFHKTLSYQKAPKQNPVNVSNARKKHSKRRCFLESLSPSEARSPSFAGPFFILRMHMEEQKA